MESLKQSRLIVKAEICIGIFFIDMKSGEA